jgi:predicted nucleic acid-binding protein
VSQIVLVDTGPLVALLDRADRYHDWAKAQMAALSPPLVTCEAVLAETCYLLRSLPRAIRELLEWLEQGLVAIRFRLDHEAVAVSRLIDRYANVPMSLADACLVRMTEQHGSARVLTLDSDFRIYRKHGRQVVPTIMPEPH